MELGHINEIFERLVRDFTDLRKEYEAVVKKEDRSEDNKVIRIETKIRGYRLPSDD